MTQRATPDGSGHTCGSVVGALHTDGWFSAIFWLAAVVLAGIAGYGASLLYRSRGTDVDR